MTEIELKDRTKRFALRVIKLCDALPHSRSGDAIARQIVRSGSSVAANYRALCRSKSRADFINQATIAEEESDETAFCLELIADAGLLKSPRVRPLLREANELTAIFVATRKTARRKSE